MNDVIQRLYEENQQLKDRIRKLEEDKKESKHTIRWLSKKIYKMEEEK